MDDELLSEPEINFDGYFFDEVDIDDTNGNNKEKFLTRDDLDDFLTSELQTDDVIYELYDDSDDKK